jgi:hypothetical protein
MRWILIMLALSAGGASAQESAATNELKLRDLDRRIRQSIDAAKESPADPQLALPAPASARARLTRAMTDHAQGRTGEKLPKAEEEQLAREWKQQIQDLKHQRGYLGRLIRERVFSSGASESRAAEVCAKLRETPARKSKDQRARRLELLLLYAFVPGYSAAHPECRVGDLKLVRANIRSDVCIMCSTVFRKRLTPDGRQYGPDPVLDEALRGAAASAQ